MNAERFAEWYRRQGQRVIRTQSSYWVEQGPRVYLAFPFHWVVRPTEEEFKELFRKHGALGLRYSTPFDADHGAMSYHIVFDRKAYTLKDVRSSVRSAVKAGVTNCMVGPISFDRYAQEGWALQVDTQKRQGRRTALDADHWARLCAAASGLEGFEVWGAEVKGRLVATVFLCTVDDCVLLLFQQCLAEFLPLRINNALTFKVTEELVQRPNVGLLHYGLHSLDAPESVDKFKFSMGYTVRPVRQHVVFHPQVAPLFNSISHLALKGAHKLLPRSEFLAKSEGMIRFYREGRKPLSRQEVPGALIRHAKDLGLNPPEHAPDNPS